MRSDSLFHSIPWSCFTSLICRPWNFWDIFSPKLVTFLVLTTLIQRFSRTNSFRVKWKKPENFETNFLSCSLQMVAQIGSALSEHSKKRKAQSTVYYGVTTGIEKCNWSIDFVGIVVSLLIWPLIIRSYDERTTDVFPQILLSIQIWRKPVNHVFRDGNE